MFCYKCGSSVSPNSKFCGKCGAVMQQSDTSEQVNENPVPENDTSGQAESATSPEPVQHEQAHSEPVQPFQASQPDAPLPDAFPSAQQTSHPPFQASQPGAFGQAQPQQPFNSMQQPFNSTQQPIQQPLPPPYQPPVPPKSGGSKGLGLKIGIPAAVLVILITGAIIFFTMSNSPMGAIGKSLANVGDEFNQRLDGTPLEAFEILFDSLESGTVSVDFNYSDRWSHSRGSVALHSDQRRGEYAVEADVTVEGITVDLELYFNRDRAAARVSQFSNNFYGITYDSFRNDFRSFANMLYLDSDEISSISDVVEMFAEIMRTNPDLSISDTEYGKLLSDFMGSAEVNSDREEIQVGTEKVSGRVTTLTFTDREIIKLFVVISFITTCLHLTIYLHINQYFYKKKNK